MSPSYSKYQDNNMKHDHDRYDMYNSSFETPIDTSDPKKMSLLSNNIKKWTEFCAFLKWMPDVYFDMVTPKDGQRIFLDLYQRVMLRLLVRFPQNYFCNPRGSSKTMIGVMAQYFVALTEPGITLSITASTKEAAVKIWREKHDEILKYYPSLKDEIVSAQFAKDTGKVVFQNGSVVDNLANAQNSKGLRRRRGNLEESALIDKDLYDDAIEPIFNIPRTTMTGEIDPTELNGQINRFSTSGYKNSDEYEKIRQMVREMIECEGSFVFGSDWFIPIHFKRQKKSVIDKARKGNVVRFRQNYLEEWIGASDGALLNISKLIKARTLTKIELECPKDKKGNLELCEIIFGVDVARSASQSNNKTAIVVLKIIRNLKGAIRQVQVINIVVPPNGLNFKEQSIIIKKLFYKYGGHSDLAKSRVKAVVIDGNVIGRGLIDRLLEDVTDPDTNEELGCWDTINTEQRPEVEDSPKIVYDFTAQGLNGDIITQFLNYVESGKLKLLKSFEDVKDSLPKNNNIIDENEILAEAACINTQQFIDEVANLRLKKTTNSITVECVVKRIDKDRYSAMAYALFYIFLFLEKEEQEYEEEPYILSAGF